MFDLSRVTYPTPNKELPMKALQCYQLLEKSPLWGTTKCFGAYVIEHIISGYIKIANENGIVIYVNDNMPYKFRNRQPCIRCYIP